MEAGKRHRADSLTNQASKANCSDGGSDGPTNKLVMPLLTDMYQVSMTYAYWKADKQDDEAVFDLFFRKCPFKGEFCVFAGLDEIIKYLPTYKFGDADIEYLQTLLPAEPEFFQWLRQLDCSKVKVYAVTEGSVVFPKCPLLRVEGPLGIAQLLETTLLNLVNYPSLIATNACRMRLAVGPSKTLLEFGLRRAQGPDGALSASKYSYLGGFDGTSNVLAGKLFGIGVKGTHAHSYVMSYTGLKDLRKSTIASNDSPGTEVEFLALVLDKRVALGFTQTNDGELASFISYAQAYPNGLLALVDTYSTLESGVPNFICVGLALKDLGYNCVGIRLDSGDLAYLSKKTRRMFKDADKALGGGSFFTEKMIVASNDLNEEVLYSLEAEGHEIDCFGVGTNLVTCLKQPALGCVYKLVSINDAPRIKLSQEVEKLVLPGRKDVFRLYSADDLPLLDVIMQSHEPAPEANKRILVRHPFEENKRAYVTPARVEKALQLVWDSENGAVVATPSLDERRARCSAHISAMRTDHIRRTNPTPFKVSVTQSLYTYTHDLWLANAPVSELA